MTMARDITSCMGYQQITNVTSPVGLTLPNTDLTTGVSAIPTTALIVVEGQAVRYRDDGVNPTASVGMPILPGSAFFYDGDLTRIRFIETTASAVINVAYYK